MEENKRVNEEQTQDIIETKEEKKGLGNRIRSFFKSENVEKMLVAGGTFLLALKLIMANGYTLSVKKGDTEIFLAPNKDQDEPEEVVIDAEEVSDDEETVA